MNAFVISDCSSEFLFLVLHDMDVLEDMELSLDRNMYFYEEKL